MEYPTSDKCEASDSVVASGELEFFSPTLDERLRSDEAFLKQAVEKLEHRRSEAEQLHRAYDEKERLAALEANRRRTQDQTQQRNEKEQKLHAEIEALRNAEAEQRQRIEEANAASRRPSEEESRTEPAPESAPSRDAAEDEAQLDPPDAIRVVTESEAEMRATEQQQLNAEIKTLGQLATQQIDRMDEAKSRLTILEQVRVHAEKMVYERAMREIRLQAEIEALHQAEAAQVKRIEQNEAEARQLTEKQNRAQVAAEARLKADAEARQVAAAEALRQVDEEARCLAEEEEQRIEHLETIRARAEAASQERAEKESLLNSQLMAFSEAAAEQLERIAKAEADLSEAHQEFQQLEEKAREATEQAANRFAQTEQLRKAAEEEWAQAETESQALAEQEERRLAELDLLRVEAEAAAEKRAEVERKLNADLESLAENEVAQRKRLEDARSQAQRLSEEETRLRRIAEEEEERIVELESLRNQAETRVERGHEEEQQLVAEIEALNQIESDQKNRIADAEVSIHAREEELQHAEAVVSHEEEDTHAPPATDPGVETNGFSGDIQVEANNVETIAGWSINENSDQSSSTAADDLEMVSEHASASSLVDGLDTPTVQSLTNDDRESMHSLPSEESLEGESEETLIVTSLAQRLRTDDPAERAKAFQDLTRLDENEAFGVITGLFDDGSEEVRNAAARALYALNPSRAETFTRALREGAPERRRQIIRALDCSGLAAEAIESLAGESREKTYDAFSVLFLMAKAGEVQTLLHAIEKHSNSAVRLSVIKLLTFSNRPDIIPALRSLAVRGALPIEVRSALMESIYEISSSARERALSAA
jgi:hypothetical protein